MKSFHTLSTAGFLALAMLGICFTAGTASGRDPKEALGNWDNLKSLKPGQEIRVVMDNMDSYQGEFKSLSDDQIALRHAKHEWTLDHKHVLRVSLKTGQSHVGRNAAIGVAIGAVAGLGIGLGADKVIWDHTNCTEGPAFSGSGPRLHTGELSLRQ